MTEPLKILFLAAEAAPLVKVGGLGDVAGALPAALQALPESPEIKVVIPLHGNINRTKLKLEPLTSFPIAHRDGAITAEVFTTLVSDMKYFLIAGDPFEAETPVYSPDTLLDGHKFTFFSLAALELTKQLNWQPDILHAQDWHTAPAVHALKTILQDDPFFDNTSTLLTVHNLPYLGDQAGPAMAAFGLPPAKSGSRLPKWARHMPLPLGLEAAGKINTVSPGYANEMLTKAYGVGLEKFLRSREADLLGILNGINLERWDPSGDPQLPFNYNQDTLQNREKNKIELLAELGLDPQPSLPLIAYIGRMAGQKGVDLAIQGLNKIKHLPWQAVFLGTGEEQIEAQALQLAENLPAKVKTIIRYDDQLARRIYAGADMILIPSRYEPCGLIQMIAMRYGCVPVATATGGLKDTITDAAHPDSTGYLFQRAAPAQLAKTLKRALNDFMHPDHWRGLQRRGMAQDFSWEGSARKYFQVYQSLLTD
ncbi:MAG: glycogen/starch synthase [Chloroflexota bacterium]